MTPNFRKEARGQLGSQSSSGRIRNLHDRRQRTLIQVKRLSPSDLGQLPTEVTTLERWPARRRFALSVTGKLMGLQLVRSCSHLRSMKPMLLLSFCARLGSTGALAQQERDAPEWVSIKTENDGDTSAFVDVKSIRAGNGYRQAWAREVFKPNPNAIKEIQVQQEMDCRDWALRILRSRVYQRDGSVEDQALDDGWFYVLADDTSGLKALHISVCSARIRA